MVDAPSIAASADDLARRGGFVQGAAVHGLAAAVWDDEEGRPVFTLTPSTSEPGWQLTEWDDFSLLSPYGHQLVASPTDVLDPDVLAAWEHNEGEPASWLARASLRQLVFEDGRTLVRRGSERVNNPPRLDLKASLIWVLMGLLADRRPQAYGSRVRCIEVGAAKGTNSEPRSGMQDPGRPSTPETLPRGRRRLGRASAGERSAAAAQANDVFQDRLPTWHRRMPLASSRHSSKDRRSGGRMGA